MERPKVDALVTGAVRKVHSQLGGHDEPMFGVQVEINETVSEKHPECYRGRFKALTGDGQFSKLSNDVFLLMSFPE